VRNVQVGTSLVDGKIVTHHQDSFLHQECAQQHDQEQEAIAKVIGSVILVLIGLAVRAALLSAIGIKLQ
jgi:hypothetical protein